MLRTDDGAVEVRDGDEVLVYRRFEVSAPGDITISHESRGGTLVSATGVSVGDAWVEISHLGHGPEGGELVIVVTAPNGQTWVAMGSLVTDALPETVPASWPEAVDLAIGLVDHDTVDAGSKDDLERFHQDLLGVLYGPPNV